MNFLKELLFRPFGLISENTHSRTVPASIEMQGRVFARLASWPLGLNLLQVVLFAHDVRLALDRRAFRLDGAGGVAGGLGKELTNAVEHGNRKGLELRFLFRPLGLISENIHSRTVPASIKMRGGWDFNVPITLRSPTWVEIPHEIQELSRVRLHPEDSFRELGHRGVEVHNHDTEDAGILGEAFGCFVSLVIQDDIRFVEIHLPFPRQFVPEHSRERMSETMRDDTDQGLAGIHDPIGRYRSPDVSCLKTVGQTFCCERSTVSSFQTHQSEYTFRDSETFIMASRP